MRFPQDFALTRLVQISLVLSLSMPAVSSAIVRTLVFNEVIPVGGWVFGALSVAQNLALEPCRLADCNGIDEGFAQVAAAGGPIPPFKELPIELLRSVGKRNSEQ